jgi:hypothetical protein
MKSPIVAGLLLAIVSVTAQAQIMKCVSKDGKIEFASSCPPGTKEQNTGVSNKAVSKPPVAAKDSKDGKDGKDAKDSKDKAEPPKSLADRDAEYRKRQAEQKEAAAKAAQQAGESEDRRRACTYAQSNLTALRNRQRIMRTDPATGERSAYDEADYLREIGVNERIVADNCKG